MRAVVQYQDYSDFNLFQDFERDFDTQHPAVHRQPRLRDRQLGAAPRQPAAQQPRDLRQPADDDTLIQRRLPELQYRLRSTQIAKTPVLPRGRQHGVVPRRRQAQRLPGAVRPLRPLPAGHPAGEDVPLAQPGADRRRAAHLVRRHPEPDPDGVHRQRPDARLPVRQRADRRPLGVQDLQRQAGQPRQVQAHHRAALHLHLPGGGRRPRISWPPRGSTRSTHQAANNARPHRARQPPARQARHRDRRRPRGPALRDRPQLQLRQHPAAAAVAPTAR